MAEDDAGDKKYGHEKKRRKEEDKKHPRAGDGLEKQAGQEGNPPGEGGTPDGVSVYLHDPRPRPFTCPPLDGGARVLGLNCVSGLVVVLDEIECPLFSIASKSGSLLRSQTV